MEQLQKNTSDRSVLEMWQYGGKWSTLQPSGSSSAALPEDHGTTHVSVPDQWGNAVALTSTINTYFGSLVFSESTGEYIYIYILQYHSYVIIGMIVCLL